MPQNHYRCPNCGTLDLITYRVQDVGGPTWPPRCVTPECFDVRMELAPQPGDYAFDLKTDGDGGKGFQKFTVHRQLPTKDGLKQVEETVDSVHALRRIERDSEQRYRDGEGEPQRFRAYAQGHSNMDVGSFGTAGTIGGRSYDSGQTPKKSKKIATRRHGTEKPKVAVARGAGHSPLKG
jgi:hypothetical protein